MTPRTDAPTAREMCTFLADYAARLLGSGATCIRLEKNVRRIGAAFGMQVEVAVFPRHIHLSVVAQGGGELYTSIAAISDCSLSFAVNAALSRLSWDVADGTVGFAEAVRRFSAIAGMRGEDRLLVLLLASVANAAFCRLFGGDAVAMAVVFGATLAGFALRQFMAARHADFRLTVIACSFVSSVLAGADGLFGLGATPEIAVGTSVLYLVPGIPFINSFSDMLDRHYICAFGRFTDALVITGCLSIGLCAGMMLMNVGMF